ncbi:MAG: diaminopimelate epimerase [Bacteroidota bacterium]|nr:diaminopimelate epimerase [Bacteroidota bacterium]
MKRLIPFEKYEGAGNDFIILDFFEFELLDVNNSDLVQLMCDRHFGIGADGLIAVTREKDVDFRMLYLNADGQFSTFCGNGSRCASSYVSGKLNKTNLHFIAADGLHESHIEPNQVRVKMSDIKNFETSEHGIIVQSGSPHLIVETVEPFNHPIYSDGKRLRTHFGTEGINVNFVAYENGLLKIATYERGVEAETLACGTGITAAAYFNNIKQKFSGNLTTQVRSKGGDLSVQMKLNGQNATDIWLIGPAKKVYSGFYEID